MAQEQTPRQQAAEAAAIRRRWLTLGEVLAVAAVAISALTFWNSYSERSNAEAERDASARKADRAAATLLLRGTPARDGESIALAPLRDDQTIQSQTIRFPGALAVDPVETTGNARIEGDWFDSALRKARRAAGRSEDSQGDERLPIAIATRFLGGGALHEDIALYDIGYVVEGSFLGGSEVRLRGLSLIGRADAKSVPARLDALWKARHPKSVRP
ncbi:hypothetical protein CLG96_13625 [Sphingomonas oleivorans]|uniref:Uncharacterized protein n=1 Tax=Sphingomonas oleivorans TaxID=1735121 RepID=A0A2T5FWK2_9SPHN|nr:hypothetical protein [Sphingomonas oleivorans]PTQ10160.1 hypothetical protein CLG96_13625 [Sphingomonas oleivorans]